MAARCSSVAFAKAQSNNKFIGTLTKKNGTTWLLQFDGWKPTGGNVYAPINEMSCPPPLSPGPLHPTVLGARRDGTWAGEPLPPLGILLPIILFITL